MRRRLRASLILLTALAGMAFAAPPAPAAITVNSTGDSGGGTLRQALVDASPGETIIVPPSAAPYALTTTELAITKSLTIAGGGASNTIIDASGTAGTRVFNITGSGLTVSISGVTIRGGRPTLGADGGGIETGPNNTLTLSGVTLTDNHAGPAGGNGAGVNTEFSTTLTISNSTVSGNATAGGGNGGGVYIGGTSGDIENSTITGNTTNAGGNGAGIYDNGATSITISRSTVSGNQSSGDGGGMYGDAFVLVNSTVTGNSTGAAGQGGGIYSTGTGTSLDSSTIASNTAGGGGNIAKAALTPFANVTNTIVAKGIATTAGSENCAGTIGSAGHNLDSRDQCGFHSAGDKASTDPLLGPLAVDGGPTQTMAIGPGSPALDAGPTSGCPTTDQRGVPRPQQSACDIGAFEYQPPSVPALPDKIPPALSQLVMKPGAFAAAGRGGSVARIRKKKRTGTTVSYELSEAATVAFTVQHQVKGRKKGKKCVTKRKRGKRCKIYKAIRGSFSTKGNAGVNKFKFTGRINGKKLRPGSYRLIGTPTDAAQNVGAGQRKAFRIKR